MSHEGGTSLSRISDDGERTKSATPYPYDQLPSRPSFMSTSAAGASAVAFPIRNSDGYVVLAF